MEWSLFGLRCREVGPVELRGSCLYNLALRDINTSLIIHYIFGYFFLGLGSSLLLAIEEIPRR